MSCSKCKFQGRSKLELPCLECTNNRATDNFKPMTNADRIRMMSNEELVDIMLDNEYCVQIKKRRYCRLSCVDCLVEWLQEEWIQAEGDGDER